MISRGEVGLIVATLGVATQIFQPGEKLYSGLFMVIVLTTMITPPMVRWVFREKTHTGEAF
jgi:Kef-type K+ transport system membrane component KefB